jgi:3-deoxy-D-manno-octulosonic-acid transferase
LLAPTGMSPGKLSRRSLTSLVAERLWPRVDPINASVWIQAVSLGEIEVARTLVERLSLLRPALRILVTATTPAGVELLPRRIPTEADRIVTRPFPLDLPFSVRRFFDAARPDLLVLVETEIWPGVLTEAGRRGVPVLLVNARLSERSTRRLRAAARLFRKPLAAVQRVLARTEEDAGRFLRIGIPEGRIEVSGDMKFDRPVAPAPPFADEVPRLAAGRPILVAGSWADEEVGLLIEARSKMVAEGVAPFLVVAPRRTESFDAVTRRLQDSGLATIRRSRLGSDLPTSSAEVADILLLDSVGELAGTYGLGCVAILGGTFAPKGGHNVLEPLRCGVPTIVGPSTENIVSALEAAEGAVFRVTDAPSLAATTLELLREPGLRKEAARAAESLFLRHAGATARCADATFSILDSRRADLDAGS